MAKRPSFQFYPSDWRNNANLRRCGWAARGAWIEVMSLMHDSDVYGVLRWSMKEIAQAVGCPVSLIKELADKGVMKGSEKDACEPYIYTPRSGRKDGDPVTLVESQSGPIWYSSRMVKDEYLRGIRGGDSRFDGDENPSPKTTSKTSPKGGLGECQSDGSSTSSSSSPSGSTKPDPAVVGFLTPNSEKPATTTPTHQRPIDDWQPRPETVEALSSPTLHNVPEKFIREQILEFRTYWRDRNLPATSWDSKFIQRCASQWKTYGHEWRENPEKSNANGNRTPRTPAEHRLDVSAATTDYERATNF